MNNEKIIIGILIIIIIVLIIWATEADEVFMNLALVVAITGVKSVKHLGVKIWIYEDKKYVVKNAKNIGSITGSTIPKSSINDAMIASFVDEDVERLITNPSNKVTALGKTSLGKMIYAKGWVVYQIADPTQKYNETVIGDGYKIKIHKNQAWSAGESSTFFHSGTSLKDYMTLIRSFTYSNLRLGVSITKKTLPGKLIYAPGTYAFEVTKILDPS